MEITKAQEKALYEAFREMLYDLDNTIWTPATKAKQFALKARRVLTDKPKERRGR